MTSKWRFRLYSASRPYALISGSLAADDAGRPGFFALSDAVESRLVAFFMDDASMPPDDVGLRTGLDLRVFVRRLPVVQVVLRKIQAREAHYQPPFARRPSRLTTALSSAPSTGFVR